MADSKILQKFEISRPKTESPPPNCAICLGNFTDRCYSNSCMHQFCFKCLKEWSKIKPECPLCKQSFKSIIHNIKANNEYDEYYVQTITVEDNDYFDASLIYLPLATPSPLVYLPNAASSPLSHQYHIRRRRGDTSTAFRRNIYSQNLWVYAPPDLTGRYREVSPIFYRNNPAARARLVPWLNRELNALLSNNTQHVMNLVDIIMDHLLRHHICSHVFRSLLFFYLGDKTEQFIHEFYNFMRSPFDMIGYDRQVIYAERPTSPTPFIDISDNDNDNDVIFISQSSDGLLYPNRFQYNNNNNHNNNYNIDNNINNNAISNNNINRNNSRLQTQIIDLDDSDSDEPIIVSEELPLNNTNNSTSSIINKNKDIINSSSSSSSSSSSDENDNNDENHKPKLPVKLRLKIKSKPSKSKEKRHRKKRKLPNNRLLINSSSDSNNEIDCYENRSRKCKKLHKKRKYVSQPISSIVQPLRPLPPLSSSSSSSSLSSTSGTTQQSNSLPKPSSSISSSSSSSSSSVSSSSPQDPQRYKTINDKFKKFEEDFVKYSQSHSITVIDLSSSSSDTDMPLSDYIKKRREKLSHIQKFTDCIKDKIENYRTQIEENKNEFDNTNENNNNNNNIINKIEKFDNNSNDYNELYNRKNFVKSEIHEVKPDIKPSTSNGYTMCNNDNNKSSNNNTWYSRLYNIENDSDSSDVC